MKNYGSVLKSIIEAHESEKLKCMRIDSTTFILNGHCASIQMIEVLYPEENLVLYPG